MMKLAQLSPLGGEEATIVFPGVTSVGGCSVRRHYGSLDAVDGLFLRVDPVSDVSSGSDGSRRRVKTFSRKLDLASTAILDGLLV